MERHLCISTLDLEDFQHGGVVNMAMSFADAALELGFSPFFITPSVKIHKTFKRQIHGEKFSVLHKTSFRNIPNYQFGALFPEFEFNSHRFSKKELFTLLTEKTPCFAVSGNNHAARPFLDLGYSYKVWAASTYWEDCETRISEAPLSTRKILDLISKPFCQRLEYRAYDKAVSTATITSYTKDHVLRLNRSWNNKISVITVPVDCSKYQPISNPSCEQIIFIGRLSDPRKNLNLLLNSFSKIAETDKNLNLVLIGSGNTNTKQIVEKHRFASRIRWIERISEEEKIREIQNSLALVISSYQEGLGIVGSEALACGVPVISTPCGGPSDFVIHEQTGLCLKGFQTDELSDSILRLMKDALLRNRLAKQGREFAESYFSLDSVRPKLQAFIQQSTS